MGTNYYFEVKNTNEIIEKVRLVSPFITNEVLNKIQAELYEIHIGKRSAGWKPLFAKTSYYSTIDELKTFYNDNKDNLIIKSEYQNEITWEELEKELINWLPNGKTHMDNLDGYWSDKYYIDNNGYQWTTISDFC